MSVAVAAVAFAIYLALLCPVPAGKDGSEFTLVLATLGVAHPTGYPLYTLLGHVWVTVLHAAGAPWGWTANAFSALGGALAMGLLHALAARLLAPRLGARAAGAVALLPVAALALDPAWTAETTLAEVNSWHLAWVAAAALAALAIARVLSGAGAAMPPAARRAAFGWGLLAGAGLAHHTTSVLFSLPLTIALAVAARRAGRPLLPLALSALAGAIVPLLSLGYVGWRAFQPAALQWPALDASLASVFDHVTGAQYRVFLGRFAPLAGERHLLARYVYPWLAAGIVGAVALLARRDARANPALAALAVAVLLQTCACFGYGVPDPSPYFLPPLAVGLVLLAAALVESAALRWAAWLVVPLLAAGVLAFAAHGWGVARERTGELEQFDALLRDMWTHVPNQPAFVVWDDDMAWRLRAFQRLDGLQPALVVVQPRMLSYPAERRRFIARFGFDPLAGLDARAAAPARSTYEVDESQVLPRVQRVVDALDRSSLPVYLFLPQVPSVRLLRKPGEVPPGAMH